MKITYLESKLKSRNLKQSTIITNLRNFKRICKDIFNKTIDEIEIKDLENYELVFNYVNDDNKCCQSMKNKILNTIINIVKCFDFSEDVFEIYKGKFNELCKSYLDDRQLGEPYEKEIENLITFKEIKKVKNKLKLKLTDTYKSSVDIPYLLLSVYDGSFPILRCQDWYSSRVFDNDKEIKSNNVNIEKDNYLNLKSKILTVNNYKTMKRYGKREILLPTRVINIIKKFKKKSKSNWILPSHNKIDHISDANCTHLLQKMLNKKVSCHMLRKIYISDMIENNTPIKKMKEIAKIMAHSLSSQQLTYQRFTKKVMNKN
jgi:site-specific recombinase XerD